MRFCKVPTVSRCVVTLWPVCRWNSGTTASINCVKAINSLGIRDNLAQCVTALRTHKLRASLTMLGLTMGVATLITVMTIVQGANLYVEQKIANLGTNVFQIARTPFAVTDFTIIIKAPMILKMLDGISILWGQMIQFSLNG